MDFGPHDENVRGTRTPEELAALWRAARPVGSRSYLSDQTVYRESDTRTKIGYRGPSGSIEAVLTYEKRENGWRLVSAIECE